MVGAWVSGIEVGIEASRLVYLTYRFALGRSNISVYLLLRGIECLAEESGE